MFGPDISAPPLVAEELVGFLVDRLTEELAALWERDLSRTPSRSLSSSGPGLAAQLEAVDGLLGTLRGGALPSRLELRLLVHAYATHPDFEPEWSRF